jgi:Flp pilus assembly protein TadD
MITNGEIHSGTMKTRWSIPFAVVVMACIAVLTLRSNAGLLFTQAQRATDSVTLYGVVNDADGRKIMGATVQLKAKTGVTETTTTDGTGAFRFLVALGGTYTLYAKSEGIGEGTLGPLEFTNQTEKQVVLILKSEASGPQISAEQPAFFDEPQFTVSGVTDTTNLGGHGSNATSRTKAELTTEITKLSQSSVIRESTGNGLDISAQRALREEADASPDDFASNHEAGKALAAAGNDTAALSYLERAARLKPDDFDNGRALAIAYDRQGNLKRAREVAQALSKKQEHESSENKADVLHLLGNIEEKSGNPLEAVRHFQHAAELHPSEMNLFDWGAELLLHNAPEPAGDVFARGHQLFPQSARMLIGLGISSYARGSYDQAVERLGEASDLTPDDPTAYLFLGRLRSVDTGRSTVYLAKLQRFAERHPKNAWANYYYALALLKQRSALTTPRICHSLNPR